MSKIKEKFISLYHENKWYWFLIAVVVTIATIDALISKHNLDKYGVYGVAEIVFYNKMSSKGHPYLKYMYFVDGFEYNGSVTGQYLNCEDNDCIGRRYEIKYLPQNPNKCFIYFDRPVE
ncbi:MAG: hypothetical protein KA168_07835 [Chitinophagales bacterium]|jgi:hypothetical protein|nr:hypothetical protein [Chitinophagales bacterium]